MHEERMLKDRNGVPIGSIWLRPYNMKELAALYQVSIKTLRRWLKPFEKKLGKRYGYYYNITQVRKIFSWLEFPTALYENQTAELPLLFILFQFL